MYIKFKEFKKITYTKPEKRNKIYITDAKINDKIVLFQLTNIKTPLGIYNENGIYKIDINLGPKYSEKIKNIEKLSIKKVHKFSKEWFNSNKDIKFMENNFISNIKHCNDEILLTIPLKVDNGKLLCHFYNKDKNRIHWKEIKQNKIISVILKYNGMKFYKKKFSNDWEIVQIKCHNTEKLYEQYELEEMEDKNLILDRFYIESESESDIDIDIDVNIEEYIDNLYEKYDDIEKYNKI